LPFDELTDEDWRVLRSRLVSYLAWSMIIRYGAAWTVVTDETSPAGFRYLLAVADRGAQSRVIDPFAVVMKESRSRPIEVTRMLAVADVAAGVVVADAPSPPGSAAFDMEFAALSGSRLLPELWVRAVGDEYPAPLRVFSPTTWTDLHRVVDALALRPDQVLVDLGCGEGGPGLWLAARAGARLIGVDFSGYALASAARRAGGFLPDGRARFVRGTLAATGLADASVNAVCSFYAFIFCTDKLAGLVEPRRILRPGGRIALLVSEVLDPAEAGPSRVADYRPLVRAAGLDLLAHEEKAGARERMQRLYALWLEHADELCADVGDEAAAALVEEARLVGPRLAAMREVLVVAGRPG
jgi:ubiquinone/menaquinone biosynthesis C-methylase UbiE